MSQYLGEAVIVRQYRDRTKNYRVHHVRASRSYRHVTAPVPNLNDLPPSSFTRGDYTHRRLSSGSFEPYIQYFLPNSTHTEQI